MKLIAKSVERPPSKSELIDAFIVKFFASGPRPSMDAEKEADVQGFSKNTYKKRLERMTVGFQEKGRIGWMRSLRDEFKPAPGLGPMVRRQQPASVWPYPSISLDSLTDEELYSMLASAPIDDPLIRRIMKGTINSKGEDDEKEDDDDDDGAKKLKRASLSQAVSMLRNILSEVEGSLADGSSATDAFTAIERRMEVLEGKYGPSQY